MLHVYPLHFIAVLLPRCPIKIASLKRMKIKFTACAVQFIKLLLMTNLHLMPPLSTNSSYSSVHLSIYTTLTKSIICVGRASNASFRRDLHPPHRMAKANGHFHLTPLFTIQCEILFN